MAAVQGAYEGLDLSTGGMDRDSLVSVTAQTEADYEDAAFGSGLSVIVGASDVADILGVTRQRVHQLAQTAGFPAPIARIKMGPLWDGAAIVTFASRWQRKPGRPAKHGGSLPPCAWPAPGLGCGRLPTLQPVAGGSSPLGS